MKQPTLDTIQNILFLELRPWMNRTTSEAKYKQLFQEVRKEYYSFQPLYEVDFPKPLSSKRKYYHAIVEIDAIQYLNTLHHKISTATNDKEKKYWVHTSLTKVLSQKLRDVRGVIEGFHFDLPNINNKANSTNNQDDTYIIQYLRFQLTRIYLEIQDLHKEYLKDEPFSFEELNEKYFSDSLPKSYIKEATKLILPTPVNQTIQKSNMPNFEPKAFDIRESKKGVLAYSAIIKNPDRFSRFEEQLFTNGLIDENYNFQNEHGQIQELAATFQTLVKKSYFNPRKFPGNRVIKPVEIRKFLDHRYGSNTDKQFRDWGNNPDKLAAFTEVRWIDRLPVS